MKSHPEIRSLSENVAHRLTNGGVKLLNREGEDDESIIDHYLNVDILIQPSSYIRLYIAYDGWGLVIKQIKGGRSTFGGDINWRSTRSDYFQSLEDEIVEASLAFATNCVAAVVHFEAGVPLLAQLYERTNGGYKYLSSDFITQHSRPWLRENDSLTKHIHCDELTIMYDDSPKPRSGLSEAQRSIFANMELKSTLKVEEFLPVLQELKPVSQIVKLLDY